MTTTVIDLTGRTFGRWTVLKRAPAPNRRAKSVYWYCRCACGNESRIQGNSLRNGRSTRCQDCNAIGRRRDLTGQRFGAWTVLAYVEHFGNHSYWTCRCDCGEEHTVNGASLIRGGSTRCVSCAQSIRMTNRHKGAKK